MFSKRRTRQGRWQDMALIQNWCTSCEKDCILLRNTFGKCCEQEKTDLAPKTPETGPVTGHKHRGSHHTPSTLQKAQLVAMSPPEEASRSYHSMCSESEWVYVSVQGSCFESAFNMKLPVVTTTTLLAWLACFLCFLAPCFHASLHPGLLRPSLC